MIRKVETLKKIYRENPSQLQSANWVRLLLNNDSFENGCPWDAFSGRDWIKLILEKPRYAEKCIWRKFTLEDWDVLLSRDADFAAKLDQNTWCRLLEQHPYYVHLCKCAIFDQDNWTALYHINRDFYVGIKSRIGQDQEDEFLFDHMHGMSERLWNAMFEIRESLFLVSKEERKIEEPHRKIDDEVDMFAWADEYQKTHPSRR